jgi:hypothetical protein
VVDAEDSDWQTFFKAILTDAADAQQFTARVQVSLRPPISSTDGLDWDALSDTVGVVRLVLEPIASSPAASASAHVLDCTYGDLRRSGSAELEHAGRLVPAVVVLAEHWQAGEGDAFRITSPDLPQRHATPWAHAATHARVGEVVATVLAASAFRRALRRRRA